MNTTGCPPLYAYDNFFSREPVSTTCDLNIPLFVILVECAALIHLAVALKRTQVIMQNRGKRQGGRNKNGGGSSKSWYVTVTPYITLFQSWGSFITSLFTPLVWYLFAPAGFMLAVEGTLFNIQCELWLAKLIRLGGRIIPSTAVSSMQSSSSAGEKDSAENESKAIFDRLSQTDRPLQVMQAICRVLLATQFISGAIAFPIAASAESFLIRFTVGLEAPLGWIYAACLIWQYFRCEAAITKTSALTKRMLSGNQEQSANATLAAVRKMRQQRYILIICSSFACTLALLFAVDVIPIRYWLFLLAQAVDSSTQGTMLYVLLKRSRKRSRPTEGSSTNNNNNNNKVNNNNIPTGASSPQTGMVASSFVAVASRTDQ